MRLDVTKISESYPPQDKCSNILSYLFMILNVLTEPVKIYKQRSLPGENPFVRASFLPGSRPQDLSWIWLSQWQYNQLYSFVLFCFVLFCFVLFCFVFVEGFVMDLTFPTAIQSTLQFRLRGALCLTCPSTLHEELWIWKNQHVIRAVQLHIVGRRVIVRLDRASLCVKMVTR